MTYMRTASSGLEDEARFEPRSLTFYGSDVCHRAPRVEVGPSVASSGGACGSERKGEVEGGAKDRKVAIEKEQGIGERYYGPRFPYVLDLHIASEVG